MPQGPIRKGAGQRRHEVQFQKPTREEDELGGQEDIVWSTHTTVYGAVEPGSVATGTDRPQVPYTISVPYREAIVTEQREAAQRALAAGQVFTVIAVIDPETKHRDLVCQCAEIFL